MSDVYSKSAMPPELEQLKFESLLADFSARFVNLPGDQVDREIKDAQRKICECLDLDHCSVWQRSHSEPEIFLLTHLFRDPPLPPAPERMDGDSYFPWSQQRLMNRAIVRVPSAADLPPEAAVDKVNWEAFGIKSTLAFPLWVGGGPVFGVLAFDSTTREREWPESLVNRLQLLAQVFANALSRQRIERALIESETRLRLAAASANAGLWTLEPARGRLWATEKTKELFGTAPEEEFDLKKFLSLVHPEDREPVRSIIERAIQSGEDSSIEYRTIRPNGEIRWISSRGRRCSGEIGEPARLMGVSSDITERKRREVGLQKSYSEVKQLKDRLQAESDYLQEEIKDIGRFDEIIGQSEAARSPVNASTLPLRAAPHDSGPMRVANPLSCDFFIHYTSPV